MCPSPLKPPEQISKALDFAPGTDAWVHNVRSDQNAGPPSLIPLRTISL